MDYKNIESQKILGPKKLRSQKILGQKIMNWCQTIDWFGSLNKIFHKKTIVGIALGRSLANGYPNCLKKWFKVELKYVIFQGKSFKRYSFVKGSVLLSKESCLSQFCSTVDAIKTSSHLFSIFQYCKPRQHGTQYR